jgi:hypothetical protein
MVDVHGKRISISFQLQGRATFGLPEDNGGRVPLVGDEELVDVQFQWSTPARQSNANASGFPDAHAIVVVGLC